MLVEQAGIRPTQKSLITPASVPTLLPIMERTSSSGDVGVPEMSGLLLLRLRDRFRLRLAGLTAERAIVA